MKLKNILIIISAAWFLGGLSLQVSAQQKTTAANNGTQKKNNKSSQKFISYYDKFIVRPFINGSSQDLDIKYFSRDKEGESSSKNIEYRPATVTNIGIGLSYKWFGFSISAKGDSIPDKNRYGESEYLDFQLFMYWRQIGLDLFIASYSGYYLKNNDTFNLSRGDPGTIRSDLTTNTIGFNVIYCFSEDYSLNAAFKQSEIQEKSSGSFMLMGSMKAFSIESDSSLVIPGEEASFYNDTGYKGGEYSSLGIAAGYGYTLRIWYFSISGALFIGTGVMEMRYDVAAGRKEKSQSYIKTSLKLSAALNSDKYFGGLLLSFDKIASEAFWVDTAGVSASVANGYVEIFAGYRFDL